MRPKKKVPAWAVAVEKLPKGTYGSSMYVGSHDLACEVLEVDRYTKKPEGPFLFAYMWRRFGPPPFGSDDYKDLALWSLCTKMEGVYLLVRPSGMSAPFAFSHICAMEVMDRLDQPTKQWRERLRKFAESEGKTVAELYPDGMMSRRMLAKVRKVIGREPDFRDWRKSTPAVRAVNVAIMEAIAELKRPVYVRDVPLTIFGTADEHVIDGIDNAEPSEFAGYGIDLDTIRKVKAGK